MAKVAASSDGEMASRPPSGRASATCATHGARSSAVPAGRPRRLGASGAAARERHVRGERVELAEAALELGLAAQERDEPAHVRAGELVGLVGGRDAADEGHRRADHAHRAARRRGRGAAARRGDGHVLHADDADAPGRRPVGRARRDELGPDDGPGDGKGENVPTSEAPISVGVRSRRLVFGRAIARSTPSRSVDPFSGTRARRRLEWKRT
jgi:hypothetical protein